jgi:predicted transcriptional regulator
MGISPHLTEIQPLITPEELRAQRRELRLRTSEAAALIGVQPRNWQRYESPVGSPSHRAMGRTETILWQLQVQLIKHVRAGGIWPPPLPSVGGDGR